MDINDFTYPHRIIAEARHLMTLIKNTSKSGNSVSSISNVSLNSLAIFSIKIFAKLQDSVETDVIKGIAPQQRFKQLDYIINEFINSNLTFKELSNYLDTLKKELSSIRSDNEDLEYILFQVEFLFLLKYVNEHDKKRFNFIDTELVDNILKGHNNNSDFMNLLKLFSNKDSENTYYKLYETPFKDIPLEGLIQLRIMDMISKKKDLKNQKKLKQRRLFFIKNIVDKLIGFKDDFISNLNEDLIFNVFFTASVLILLGYDDGIFLNKYESEKYLDSCLKTNFIEAEINDEVNKKMIEIQKEFQAKEKELISFTVPLGQLSDNYLMPLFYAILIYVILWAVSSVFLYIKFRTGIEIIMSLLIIYTIYILYETYEKSIKKTK